MSTANATPSRLFIPHGIAAWAAVAASLVAIATIDVAIVRGPSLGLFYLVPVAIAASSFGLRAAAVTTLFSVAIRMVAGVSDGVLPANAGWNAGMLAGILVMVSLLVDALTRRRERPRVGRVLAVGTIVGVAVAIGLTAVGRSYASLLQGMVGRGAASGAVGTAAVSVRPVSLDALGRLASRCLPLSRMALLGSRDPGRESCVKPMLNGSVDDQVPPDMGDVDGGPGTRLATLLFLRGDEVASAKDELRWHQTRLRTFLENQRRLNRLAWDAAEDMRSTAAGIADLMAAADALPDDLGNAAFADEEHWPGYCLVRLDEAVRERDLMAARRWSMELETATFSLVDLHRWLDFLAENFLASLDFQRTSIEPFQRIDRAGEKYEFLSAPSCLPAGMLTQHGRSNFLEIERQAERMFSMPRDRIAQLRTERHITPESLLVPPVRRAAFLAYAAALSPANRRTLAAAARTPFECSFLNNMLYRADTAEFVEMQCEVLRRFDRRVPNATVEQLMDVLYYRGHSFAAIEWTDRFQPSLVADAGNLVGRDVEVFFAACRRAHAMFDGGTYGAALSLRDSLARHVFDCVRLTDLAVTLFRNSGQSGIGHVRWLAGTHGHSVAACWGCDVAGPVIVADPLAEEDAPQVWPDGYFGGASWPQILGDNPKPYAAELYVRGLDQYVWAAGYVIRGENAGTLAEAAIPYLSRFHEARNRRVFAGPYPDY